MLEHRTGCEGVALTPEETTSFLVAAQNVARHYSIETTQRTLDWVAFIAASGSVFGTRAIALAIHSSKQRKQKRTAPGVPVVNGADVTFDAPAHDYEH